MTRHDPLDTLRAELALQFELLGDAGRDAAARLAVLQHGGTLVEPRTGHGHQGGGHWGPMECELSLLGVMGTGDDVASAARSWARRARRTHDLIAEGRAA